MAAEPTHAELRSHAQNTPQKPPSGKKSLKNDWRKKELGLAFIKQK